MLAEHELIFVDAVLGEVVGVRAFRAELPNGHRFVAWCAEARAEKILPCRVGERVRVRFSPYDFSTGELMGRCEAI